jgi:hypothetical protein
MILGFPLVERIALRLNASSGQLEDYVFGSLTVDMNPEKNASSTVLMGSAKYSNVNLLRATSVCLTRFGNTTEITIRVRSYLVRRRRRGGFIGSSFVIFVRHPRGLPIPQV